MRLLTWNVGRTQVNRRIKPPRIEGSQISHREDERDSLQTGEKKPLQRFKPTRVAKCDKSLVTPNSALRAYMWKTTSPVHGEGELSGEFLTRV